MGQIAPPPSTRMPGWLVATLVLFFLAVTINYIDRGNLATAAPLIGVEFHLSATRLGFLLTAFYLSYVPMQVVVGWLVDRFGAAPVLVAGFIMWSVTMSLTGLAQSFAGLLALRLLLGIGESVFFPASSSIIARWFPESRRGIANAVIMAGLACGPAFGVFFGGWLIAIHGWRPVFVGAGLVSLLWVIPWLAIAQPRLAERRTGRDETSPPIWAILRQRSLWGASLGHFCSNYAWYFVLSWIPYYLVHDRAWSLAQMANIGGGAYLSMAVTTMITGWYTDRRIASGASPTVLRKAFMGVGFGIAAVCIAGSAMASANVSVGLFTIACAAFGLVTPNIYGVAQSLAGATATGRWMGIQNCIGNIAGFFAPFLTGVLVDRTGSFVLAFMIAAAMCVLGAIAWIFVVGPVAPIDWRLRAAFSER
ncbi:MAG TPA: MFS transporter [Luteibacter sp.]|nr:MFS transporter [Luteibacter sp.]